MFLPGHVSWQVYGGPDLSSPRLAQLCSTRPSDNPLQVSSTGNTVTVRFKSDAYVSGRGFNASWQETQGGKHCALLPYLYDDNVIPSKALFSFSCLLLHTQDFSVNT